jgi:hypothetical protein
VILAQQAQREPQDQKGILETLVRKDLKVFKAKQVQLAQRVAPPPSLSEQSPLARLVRVLR